MRHIEGVFIGGTKYVKEPMTVAITKYAHDGSMAVVTHIAATGEPAMKASVCIPNHPPRDGCFWVKDYSENAGILQSLLDAGICELTGNVTIAGYELVEECQLLM